MRQVSCVLFVALLMASLQSPVPVWGQQDGAAQVDAAWIKAMKANDLEAIVACYAKDAVLWMPDAPEARGEAAIRAAYKGLLSTHTVKDASMSDTRYKTVGETSSGWGRFSITLVPKSGGAAVVMNGRFSEVAERRGGRWVYVVDHASLEPAAPSTGK